MIPNYWVIFIYKVCIILVLYFSQINKDGEKKYDGEKNGEKHALVFFNKSLVFAVNFCLFY